MTYHIIIIILIAIAVITLILGIIWYVANEQNHIESGIIVEKNYTPSHLVMQKSGKVTVPITYPESYEIAIQGEKNGKTVIYWMEVDEYTYNQYEIGDSYPD